MSNTLEAKFIAILLSLKPNEALRVDDFIITKTSDNGFNISREIDYSDMHKRIVFALEEKGHIKLTEADGDRLDT